MSDPLFARFGREFAAGDVLFHEGDPGDQMFVIQSGAIRITKMIASEERVIAMLGAGEFLGEMAILKESQLRYEGRILAQYRWFFKFGELFDGLIDRSRILELRPKAI